MGVSSAKQLITYDGSGRPYQVTETDTGAVTTYAYNADDTPASESRALNGVTTVRNFGYTAGQLVSVS